MSNNKFRLEGYRQALLAKAEVRDAFNWSPEYWERDYSVSTWLDKGADPAIGLP
jgi:hypothetical protein